MILKTGVSGKGEREATGGFSAHIKHVRHIVYTDHSGNSFWNVFGGEAFGGGKTEGHFNHLSNMIKAWI